jgi:hypothetical protein
MATPATSAVALDPALHRAERRHIKLQPLDPLEQTHRQRRPLSARWSLGPDRRLRQTWSQQPDNQPA